MKPNPLSSLNHLTVPVATLIFPPWVCELRNAEGLEGNNCGNAVHVLFRRASARPSPIVALFRTNDHPNLPTTGIYWATRHTTRRFWPPLSVLFTTTLKSVALVGRHEENPDHR